MFTLLNMLDRALNGVPEALRIGLYGLVTGVLAMALYWLISPQERIRAIKTRMSETRRALRAYDGSDLGQMMRLSWEAICPAARQLLLVVAPAFLAAIPVLLLIAWLEFSYSYRLPAAGDLVKVTATSSTNRALGWMPRALVAQTLPDGQYIVRWPGSGVEGRLVESGSDRDLLRLPLERPIHTLGQARWWHRLLEGANGVYLPPDGPLSRVEIDLPARLIWPGGPAWLCSWQVTFMLCLGLGAFAVKRWLKVV